MITIASFSHREEIRSLIARWLLLDFQPTDSIRIKELVNYNSVLVRRARERIATVLMPVIAGCKVVPTPVMSKGQYKDLLIREPERYACRDLARVRTLIGDYLDKPELYFRETPFDGMTYQNPNTGLFVATSRIKRVGRIAEKCSRRIVDSVYLRIEKEAQVSAQDRRRSTRLPSDGSQSASEPSTDAFVDAEKRVLSDIRAGCLHPADSSLVINDVLGFKLIGSDSDTLVKTLLDWVEFRDDLELVEREEHSNDYRATHLVVRWVLPKERLYDDPLAPDIESVFRTRGMSWDVEAGLKHFILGSERSIDFEIIVQTYEEALDSEIGHTMHEERIIRQRSNRGYHVDVARNITVLTKFLFYYALSRRESLEGIPVKLWVRYMPDTTDEILFSLMDFPAGEIGLVP